MRKWAPVLCIAALLFLISSGGPRRARALTREDLDAYYAYDPSRPLNTLSRRVGRFTYGTLHKLTYAGEKGRIPALLLIPHGPGPFPAVVLGHWLGGDKEQVMESFGAEFAKKGCIVLAPDHPHQGVRREFLFDHILGGTAARVMQNLHDAVVDLRRAVDVVQSLPECRGRPIGYAGVSLGAVLGFGFLAVETRVDAFLSIVGGGGFTDILKRWSLERGITGFQARQLLGEFLSDPLLSAEVAEHDPFSSAPFISPCPVAMFNGRRDWVVPPSCSGRLYEALKNPKTIYWYEAGHALNEAAMREAVEWMCSRLHTKPGE